jgi:predicted peptidase
MVSGNLQNAFSALLNYRVNVDREIKLTDGTTITPRFAQAAVVNPALDKFVPDKTNPDGTGSMDILISIDESWEEHGPLPLFIYNHGGGRGGPSGDYFAPVQTANGAAVLSKRQLENPGKYNAHIIATQNHSNNQDNNEALIAYVEKLAAEGKVDPSRIYMSGFSMGSMYTIGFYNRNPEFLAAIVPLAGGSLPTVEQLTANPELTKTAIWAHTHKNDGAGNSWTQYFTTGAGASGLLSEANVNVLETNQAFNFPYYGFDWTPHETEAQVFSNLIGQSNASFRYGASQEEYADKNIFDWMFAQHRNSITSSATLSGPAFVQFGDTFDVTYGLESLKQAVYAQDITIKYDAAKLEFIGQPVSVDAEKFVIVGTNSQEGSIRILGTHLNDSVNNPNQNFFKLSFKAKNTAGIADIAVTLVVLADGEGVEAEIDGDTHSVEIRKPVVPGDVNDDDRVSVGDLALFAKAYGKSSDSPDWDQVKKYDINNDGTIDIEDLVALARLILTN